MCVLPAPLLSTPSLCATHLRASEPFSARTFPRSLRHHALRRASAITATRASFCCAASRLKRAGLMVISGSIEIHVTIGLLSLREIQDMPSSLVRLLSQCMLLY